ncbi:MAG: thioredoxin domain-containing protein [Candidatus Pacearchaeota archaeon]
MTEENEVSKKSKGKFSNYWIVSTFVLAILLLGVVIYGSSFRGGSVVNANVAKEITQNFLSDYFKERGVLGDIEVINVTSVSGMYQIVFSLNGEPAGALTLSGDGKYVGQMSIIETEESVSEQPSTSTEIPKSDKPVIELFVMTHCPYGTQAEKGFIPFIEAMGNKIDAKVRFVHYFMHEPEKTETPRQVCIREEQSEKFIPYLKKFLEEGNYTTALESAGVDEEAMNECIESGRWEDYYAIDSTLSQGYGVGGSPTLVVNGVIAQSGRSPASYLTTACSAFNEVPEDCSQELSIDTPTPMWGWDESGASTSAQC